MILSANATAAAGVTVVNSLTLNSGAGSSLAIPQGSTAQLDSGGLLALNGATSITGVGTLSTSGNRTLYIHTPGSASLSIAPTIANNTGGLAKADNGAALLSSAELYTGNTFVNGGTLQLGTAQTIFITPNAPVSTGAYGSNPGFSGQVLQANLGGTLDLNGNNQVLANINSAGTLPNTGGIVTNSSVDGGEPDRRS